MARLSRRAHRRRDPAARHSFRRARHDPPLAIVFGNERRGLSTAWRDAASQLVSIPMLGVGDSLNVSSAAAILLYEASSTSPDSHPRRLIGLFDRVDSRAPRRGSACSKPREFVQPSEHQSSIAEQGRAFGAFDRTVRRDLSSETESCWLVGSLAVGVVKQGVVDMSG